MLAGQTDVVPRGDAHEEIVDTAKRPESRPVRAWTILLAVAAAVGTLAGAFGVVATVTRLVGGWLTDAPVARICLEPDLASLLSIRSGFSVDARVKSNVSGDPSEELALLVRPLVDQFVPSVFYLLQCTREEQWEIALQLDAGSGSGCNNDLTVAPLLTQDEHLTPLILETHCGSGAFMTLRVISDTNNEPAVVFDSREVFTDGIYQGAYTASPGALTIDRGGALTGFRWDVARRSFRSVAAGPAIPQGSTVIRYSCTAGTVVFTPPKATILVGETLAFIQETSAHPPCSFRVFANHEGLRWLEGVGLVLEGTASGQYEVNFDRGPGFTVLVL